MKFCVIYQQTSHTAQSPVRVVEQNTGLGVGWINRYLDREYVRRLANTTLRTYAHNLLHFVRWWETKRCLVGNTELMNGNGLSRLGCHR